MKAHNLLLQTILNVIKYGNLSLAISRAEYSLVTFHYLRKPQLQTSVRSDKL